MKIEVIRGGGLAGVAQATTVDAADLSEADAEAMRERVASAGLTDQVEATEAPAHPDETSYEVNVTQRGQTTTARASESTLPPELRDLVEWVDAAPAAKRRILPPGR